MSKDDPFEKAKAIRRGEVELPMYEELTGWIQRAPLTWLPGLLRQVVACCIHRQAFQDGKLLPYVERAEAIARDPNSMLRD